MNSRDGVYQYTNKTSGTTFFATEKDAKDILLGIGFGGWEREYISEVWQIIGEKEEV